MSLLSFAICAKNHFRHQYKGQSYSIMYDKDWYPKFGFLKERFYEHFSRFFLQTTKIILTKMELRRSFWGVHCVRTKIDCYKTQMFPFPNFCNWLTKISRKFATHLYGHFTTISSHFFWQTLITFQKSQLFPFPFFKLL